MGLEKTREAEKAFVRQVRRWCNGSLMIGEERRLHELKMLLEVFVKQSGENDRGAI